MLGKIKYISHGQFNGSHKYITPIEVKFGSTSIQRYLCEMSGFDHAKVGPK